MRGRIADSGRGQAGLRRQNLSSLLREVHVGGPRSRSELGASVRVNRSTVASLVADLSRRGLVRERPPATRAMPGRPSPLVEACSDGLLVVTAELGTDALAVGLVGLGGAVVERARIDRPREQPPQETVRDLDRLATSITSRLAPPASVVAIGVSVPGVVRRHDGFVHLAPNLGWRDVPFAALLRERLRLEVPVFVANDADMAALAEHTRGAGVGRRDFICLWGQAGLGAGVIVGGVPLTGSAGYAGEVGHMLVNLSGRPCHCGSRGCWETEVGEDALLRAAGLGADQGPDAVQRVLQAAGTGQPEALSAVRTIGRWLGIGMGALVAIFNPSAIALGGMYARLLPFVRDDLLASVAERAMPPSRDIVELMPVALGDDAALLGAAELAFAPILADPTAVAPHRRQDSAA